MHTTDNVADRQTHSDRGIGPVLGQHCGQHCGGIWPIQYNTMEFNTQYNTIFLLIKSSLFQYSVIFSDICGRNAVIFSDIQWHLWKECLFVFFVVVCLGLCLCLFCFMFMFVFMFCFCLCVLVLRRSRSDVESQWVSDVWLTWLMWLWWVRMKVVYWWKLSTEEGCRLMRVELAWEVIACDGSPVAMLLAP